MTWLSGNGTALLKIGLAVAIVAMVTIHPAWRAELQAEGYPYTEYEAKVLCEAGDHWGSPTVLWSATIGVVGDESKCQERVQSKNDECSAELANYDSVTFVVEKNCTKL
jgi:hypothetical protein